MKSLNQVFLVGFLGADAQIKTFDNGDKVATLSVATDDSYTPKEGEKVEVTDWHNVVVKGTKTVEFIESKAKKGAKVILKGKIKTRSYEKDGIKQYTTEIITTDLEVI